MCLKQDSDSVGIQAVLVYHDSMDRKKLALIVALLAASVALVLMVANLLVKWTVRIESRTDENRFLQETSAYIETYGQEAFLKRVGIVLPEPQKADVVDLGAIYEKASKAVVNISSTSGMVSEYLDYVSSASVGSGFFFDPDHPYILTCAHVVGDSSRFLITLPDSSIVQATLVAKDDDEDVAILTLLEDKEHDSLVFSDSSSLKVGQQILAIGNPLGFSATLSEGIIGGLGRVVRDPQGRLALGRIQTSAPISPGSSGGPLLAVDGTVGGMFSSIYTTNGSYQGMSFAIQSNVVRDIALELLANGEIQHGWLGIKAISLTAQLVQSLELGEDKGLLVSEITDKALARKGLKAGTQEALLGAHEVFFGGDIIIDIEGEMVDSYASLLDALSAYRANDVVKVTVNRDGELQTLELGLVKRPSNAKEMIF